MEISQCNHHRSSLNTGPGAILGKKIWSWCVNLSDEIEITALSTDILSDLIVLIQRRWEVMCSFYNWDFFFLGFQRNGVNLKFIEKELRIHPASLWVTYEMVIWRHFEITRVACDEANQSFLFRSLIILYASVYWVTDLVSCGCAELSDI